MSRPKVLILSGNFPQKAIDLLLTRCDLELCKSRCGNGSTNMEDIIRCIPGKLALIGYSPIEVNEQILKAAGPSLKVVCTMTVGYDHVDLTSMKKYSVRLGNTQGVLTEAVSETAVGLIIATTRRFLDANRELKKGGWNKVCPGWMCGRSIKDSVVGIIGCGDIGTSIADKLSKFKIGQLLYYSRSEKPAVKALGGQMVSLDEVVENSDIVVISLALNEETKFIINRRRIASMKPNAILINIGRGELIDQDALVEALQEKRIRGAGLDVMTPEPLPLDHPLMDLDNVFLLPHISYSTYETHEDMAMMTANNILAVLDNVPMPNEVFF